MLQWIVPGVAAVLALLALALTVTLLRVRSRTEDDLESARAEAAALRTQVEAIERRLSSGTSALPPADRVEYVITHLGDDREDDRADGAGSAVERIDGALFADLVLRETVVKAAALAQGVRRALSPEVRNRIRFEVRREIRASRKRRRREMKDLAQQLRAGQRAQLAEEDAA
jgi:hypothetical protein